MKASWAGLPEPSPGVVARGDRGRVQSRTRGLERTNAGPLRRASGRFSHGPRGTKESTPLRATTRRFPPSRRLGKLKKASGDELRALNDPVEPIPTISERWDYVPPRSVLPTSPGRTRGCFRRSRREDGRPGMDIACDRFYSDSQSGVS